MRGKGREKKRKTVLLWGKHPLKAEGGSSYDEGKDKWGILCLALLTLILVPIFQLK